MPTFYLKLNRDDIRVPTERAAMISTDVVAASLSAFAQGQLTTPEMPDQFVRLLINGRKCLAMNGAQCMRTGCFVEASRNFCEVFANR
jgi:hypothetical protein